MGTKDQHKENFCLCWDAWAVAGHFDSKSGQKERHRNMVGSGVNREG